MFKRRNKRSRSKAPLLLLLIPLVALIYIQNADQLLPNAAGGGLHIHVGRRSRTHTSIDPLNTISSLVPGCNDRSDKCHAWAVHEECDTNPSFMWRSCPASCGGCTSRPVEPVVKLLSGELMPSVGFGTAALGDATATAVEQALRAGYRRLDSAQAREWYKENLVGQGLLDSGIDRSEVFITTKVHPRDFGADSTVAKIRESLRDLNTTFLDMVLLHYAECWGSICQGTPPKGTWKDSWEALEGLVDEGIIKSIGVSNFQMDQLKELWTVARIKPSLVQMNSDPLNQNGAIQAYCRSLHIQFEGYSSLGSQYIQADAKEKAGNPVLQHPTILDIAALAGKSAAQVVLRWALQSGQTIVPRSTNQQHMKDNLDVFEFELSENDMERIVQLDQQ